MDFTTTVLDSVAVTAADVPIVGSTLGPGESCAPYSCISRGQPFTSSVVYEIAYLLELELFNAENVLNDGGLAGLLQANIDLARATTCSLISMLCA